MDAFNIFFFYFCLQFKLNSRTHRRAIVCLIYWAGLVLVRYKVWFIYFCIGFNMIGVCVLLAAASINLNWTPVFMNFTMTLIYWRHQMPCPLRQFPMLAPSARKTLISFGPEAPFTYLHGWLIQKWDLGCIGGAECPFLNEPHIFSRFI